MSASATTDIWCDYPGCNLWTHGVTAKRMQKRLARAEARKSGWTVFRGNDYCKEHSIRIKSP